LAVVGIAPFLVFLYSISAFNDWSARGSAFSYLSFVGGASALAGTFFGFLFGVPRTAAIPPSPKPRDETRDGGTKLEATRLEAAAPVSPNVTGEATQPNTNLEQISDWLTKILVGATLTQLGNIPDAAVRLFNTISNGLPGHSLSQGFVGSLLVYGALFGFMMGWFTARVWIGPVITAISGWLKGLGKTA
jgi:hypothetical protein